MCIVVVAVAAAFTLRCSWQWWQYIWMINIFVKSPTLRSQNTVLIQLMRTGDFSSLSMYVYDCMRTHVFVFVWLSDWDWDWVSERVRACEYTGLTAHTYWFCYEYLYLSFACVKFFFCGPNSQYDSAQHIQLKFYRRSV